MITSKVAVTVRKELVKFFRQKEAVNIGYATIGKGPNNILCLPGALGSFKTDFGPQLDSKFAFEPQTFETVVWDPPGYGTSRPPQRNFAPGFFERDATMAFELMKELGKVPFSVVGWSDGAITAMFMAHQQRATRNIRHLILLGGNSYVSDQDIKIYEGVRDVSAWSERMRAPFIEVYGEKEFRRLWNEWTHAILRFKEEEDGDICTGLLRKIPNPTLIVNGEKDPVVPPEHAKYLADHLPNSKLLIHPDGKHNLHLRYPEWFKKITEQFLLRDQSKI